MKTLIKKSNSALQVILERYMYYVVIKKDRESTPQEVQICLNSNLALS